MSKVECTYINRGVQLLRVDIVRGRITEDDERLGSSLGVVTCTLHKFKSNKYLFRRLQNLLFI